ncbi:MAG: glycosyltransferase family 61 protein [Deltaproteobacteria bacterium]|nr:glycosyltransferase family 61 protein [Deltaproteobacteria bacterium]
MWTTAALTRILRRRLLRRTEPSLESVASKSWQIAPAETTTPGPAVYLPGQLERVTGWEFSDKNPAPEMAGGVEVHHRATRSFLLEDAWLLDGTLSKGAACSYLQHREQRWPQLKVDVEIARGAVYCTPGGNRYFGQWLLDDCLSYPLAAAEGVPVTTARALSPHAKVYEEWLGMRPTRVTNARLREAIIFDDVGQNRHKSRRCAELKAKLLVHVPATPHAGVFILRGTSGDRRVLIDELAVAERLRDRRGFRIVDPMALDLPALLQACAGARVVCGVEGSGLMHGIMVQPPGGVIMALQPPNRFVAVYKHIADRDGGTFAFVVGQQAGEDFTVDADEVERTLDLLPASVAR